MRPTEGSASSDEFGTSATWIADAVTELGEEYALPAACRGSGTPAALRWLWEQLDLAPGTSLLDVGAGLGGPAALVQQHTGTHVLLLDPMTQARTAAERLFGLPTVPGDATNLPIADHAYDAVWCLGVLCTVEDQLALLRELRRVVRPGAYVGLLVFVRTVDHLPCRTPDNNFPTWRELREMLEEARLLVVAENRLDDFPEPDAAWQVRAEDVATRVRLEHGDDPRWQRAEAQARLVADLVTHGLVEGVVMVARAR